MTRSDIMKFTLVTPVADVTRVMAKVRPVSYTHLRSFTVCR